MRGKVVSALKTAPVEHRIIAVMVLTVVWFLLEYRFEMHVAAKGVEVFGLAPFADRAISLLFGE